MITPLYLQSRGVLGPLTNLSSLVRKINKIILFVRKIIVSHENMIKLTSCPGG